MPTTTACHECGGRAILVNAYFVCQECGYHEEGPDEDHSPEERWDDDDELDDMDLDEEGEW